MSTTGPGALLAGRYLLGDTLGRGGMAEVRAARDERLDRDVAVKILRPELSADPMIRQRFESEARTAARLSHPNVVNVFDADDQDGAAYIVMERLPGTTLEDEMNEGPMDVARVQSVGDQVLAALGAAHAAGIVHRDIKPGNVLTCPDGTVKVADFGIATVLGAAASLTATGLIIGTPAYLAPERIDGLSATERSDLYSVGALLYTCLAGRRPFDADSAVALMVAMRGRDATPIEELRPDTPPGMAAVIRRSMAKEPAERFGSAAEMRVALQDATLADAAAGGATVLSPGPVARAGQETTLMAAGAAAAGVAAAGAAGAGPVAATSVAPDLAVSGAPGRRLAGGPGAPPGQGRRMALLGAAAAVVILVAVLGIIFLNGPGHSTGNTGTSTTTTTTAPRSKHAKSGSNASSTTTSTTGAAVTTPTVRISLPEETTSTTAPTPSTTATTATTAAPPTTAPAPAPPGGGPPTTAAG